MVLRIASTLLINPLLYDFFPWLYKMACESFANLTYAKLMQKYSYRRIYIGFLAKSQGNVSYA